MIVFHADLPYLPWWADGMGTTLMLSIPCFFTLAGKEREDDPRLRVQDALGSSACSSASRNATCRKDVTTGGFEDTTDRTMRRTFLPEVRFFRPHTRAVSLPGSVFKGNGLPPEERQNPAPPMTSTAAAWRTTECAR